MTSYAYLRWSLISEWKESGTDIETLRELGSTLFRDRYVQTEIVNETNLKRMMEKVSDGVIKKGAESGEYKVTSWGQNSKSQMKCENFMGALGTLSKDVRPSTKVLKEMNVPDTAGSADDGSEDPDYVSVDDPNLHEHKDGTKQSHEDGDKPHHHHDDGTTHDHEGGDEPHTHDEELPNFKKMSKKALDEWAEKRGIILDRRKTKAHMIEELNKQL